MLALLLLPVLIFSLAQGLNSFFILGKSSILRAPPAKNRVKNRLSPKIVLPGNPIGNTSCENIYEEGITYFGDQVSTYFLSNITHWPDQQIVDTR